MPQPFWQFTTFPENVRQSPAEPCMSLPNKLCNHRFRSSNRSWLRCRFPVQFSCCKADWLFKYIARLYECWWVGSTVSSFMRTHRRSGRVTHTSGRVGLYSRRQTHCQLWTHFTSFPILYSSLEVVIGAVSN